MHPWLWLASLLVGLSALAAACCAGTPTDLPWGVDFGDGVRRHPTQLYESLFHALMAGVLVEVVRRGWLRNQRLKLYLIAYFVYRFASEFIRPEPVVGLGLTFYQWASLAAVVGLSLQWWAHRPGQADERFDNPRLLQPAPQGSEG